MDRSRYRFEQGDIFRHTFSESFDVALCLGVMEVTSEPLRAVRAVRLGRRGDRGDRHRRVALDLRHV